MIFCREHNHSFLSEKLIPRFLQKTLKDNTTLFLAAHCMQNVTWFQGFPRILTLCPPSPAVPCRCPALPGSALLACTNVSAVATGGAFGRTLKSLISALDNRVLFSLQNLILKNGDFFALDNRILFFQLLAVIVLRGNPGNDLAFPGFPLSYITHYKKNTPLLTFLWPIPLPYFLEIPEFPGFFTRTTTHYQKKHPPF